MYFSVMDPSWKRVRLLLLFLIFFEHTDGQKNLAFLGFQPQQVWSVNQNLLPQGDQSSVLEAPVTGSSPAEEVGSNGLPVTNFGARRSQFSSSQYVKGGASSGYDSMSRASSVFVSSSSGMQDVSSQQTSTSVGSGTSSGLSMPSQSSSSLYQSNTGPYWSKLSMPTLDSSNQPNSAQSSPSFLAVTSRRSSGLKLGGASSQLSTLSSSSASAPSQATSTPQDSSGLQLAGGSRKLVSTWGVSGLLSQFPSTSSQNAPVSSAYAKFAASPLGVGQSSSGQSSYSQYTSSSHQYVPAKGSVSYGSTVQSQATSSQSAPSSFGKKVPVPSLKWPLSRMQGFQASNAAVSQGPQISGMSKSSSLSSAGGPSSATDGSSLPLQDTSSWYDPAALNAKVSVYSQAVPSGSSLSLGQPSQWQPSASGFSQGFPTSSSVASQGFQTSSLVASQSSPPSQGSKTPSSFSVFDPAASPSRFPYMLERSQFAPAPSAKLPGYSQAVPSGSLSLSQSSQWQPSASKFSKGFQTSSVASQGFQTSGTVASQSSPPSQGFKAPSRFSTLTSASSGQFASTQKGTGRYSGLAVQPQSTSSQYSPAYSKQASLLAVSSQSAGDESSQSGTGSQFTGSSDSVPLQTASMFTDGSSLQLQGASSQYAPALDVKVPVYTPLAPSGSFMSQLSQQQPSTSWSPDSQTSFTLTSQSRSPVQTSKAPSRVSVLTSAPSSSQFSSTMERSQFSPASSQAKVLVYGQASPSGLSSTSGFLQGYQTSSSAASQGFQPLGTVASQSSPPSQGFKAPSRFSTLTSTSSGQFASTQKGTGRYSGLAVQPQSTSSQYSPAYSKQASLLAISSQSAGDESSQSGTGTQFTGSSGSVPLQTASMFTDGSSLQLQGASSQYAPALDVKVPVYTPLVPSGSFMSQLSQQQPSTSWSPDSQTSFTLTSQSSSPLQTSKAPSRLSVLTSAASPSQFSPAPSGAKVVAYGQASPSGLSSTSGFLQGFRTSQGFQTSGTVTSLSSAPSQGFKAPSRFSTFTSAASPGQFSPTKKGSGRYSGLSAQPLSTSSQYKPVSPAYSKQVSSLLAVSSQSASDQSSQSRTLTQPDGSSRYTPVQSGSTLTDYLQSQVSSSQYVPSPLDAKMPFGYSQAPQSGSVFLSQSTKKWQPSGSSSFPALSPPVDGSSQTFGPSSRTSSFFVSLRPSKLSSQASTNSAGSQMSPDLYALKQSSTDSLGSSVDTTSQGTFSGPFSDPTSVSSGYVQRNVGSSRSSQSYSAPWRYFSSVKG